MNHCVPDWNLDDGNRSFGDLLPTANQKKSTIPDNELIELLWRNGHVVMHSQAQRNSPTTVTEFKQTPKPGPSFKCGDSLVNSGDLIREEETSSWFQYSLDDPLEKELCSGFFSGMPVADAADADKLNKDAAAGERDLNFETKEINAFAGSASKHSNLSFEEHMMPTPKSHVTGSTQQAPSLEKAGIVNFAHFSRPTKVDLGFSNGQLEHNRSQYRIPLGMGESSSMVTIGSSASGDNQVQNRVDEGCTFSNDARNAHIRSGKDDVQMSSPREGVQTNAYEANATSSSGGSGSSFGRTGQQSASNLNHKRKGRGGESECHSEEAEYESVKANKRAQRSASARRTRAAEVHNLSERRRRDRINEKMRALQELIPHCNKTDKASMLDEAIEYLKSLQLQVQMMWMGSGMAPMMLPGFQPYMSRMGMGMGHAPMPSFQSPIQLPRVPLANQNHTPVFPSPALNPDNFPTQMQNIHLSESYARYLSFHHMQPPPQVMDLYASGSHTMQQNQQAAAAVPSEKIQNDQTG